MPVDYMPRQGQFLAFIYYYTKLHGRPPAESGMQHYFRVAPPAVHDMVKTLERRGYIARVPGKPRSISLLLSRADLPDLD
jgi:Mn-dependent DtxR family transcriptional regulator